MSLGGIRNTVYYPDQYPNLDEFKRTQLNVLVGLVVQAHAKKMTYDSLTTYLFISDTKQPADKINQALINDLKSHTQACEMQLSIVDNLLNLHQNLSAQILLLDTIRWVYWQKGDEKKWNQHDQLRMQLFACYQSVDNVLEAYGTYRNDLQENHDSAMYIPAFAYVGVYVVAPLLCLGGVLATGYSFTVFDSAVTTIALAISMEPIVIVAAATVLALAISLSIVGAAYLFARSLEKDWNQVSYDEKLKPCRDDLKMKHDNLNRLNLPLNALKQCSIFAATYIENVGADANKKLKKDGVDADDLPDYIDIEEESIVSINLD